MTRASVAVFGATGGCAGFALANALKAGHSCRTLTRSSPDKLRASLLAKGVSQKAIDGNLTALQGDAKDEAMVKQTLTHDGAVVDKILFGIGLQTFVFQFSLITPISLTDPHVCETTMATILRAAAELQQELRSVKKPDLYVISTTGISDGPRDVSIAFWPFYHWLLKVMHDDKKKMETLVKNSASSPDRGFEQYRVVRASLLMDGNGKGLEAIRTGTEAAPEIGYTIDRADVGLWIYKRWLEPVKDGDSNGAYTITT
ncbi:ABC1 family protein, mitochondrial [Sphaceloma murrayae]|uniref:ABC1 family protein, mitochondrial n=1 Tax=Sphaceloma murrayae TaxID=2082308 RepID=A0A2K1QRU9_9PEZI|nr:ABC1 family protein, mitochondrial [Sphaceloma murrayae]